MRPSLLLSVLLAGCADAPTPLTEAPPPAPTLHLTGPIQAARGATLTFDISLPAAAPDGTRAWLVGGDGGPAPICLPPNLGGECLDISGTRTLAGPARSVADHVELQIPVAGNAPAATFQAVVPVGARAYWSNAVDVQLFDACPGVDPNLAQPDADGDGVSEDCDLCEGDDALGDADNNGVCDTHAEIAGLWRGAVDGAAPFDVVLDIHADDGSGVLGTAWYPASGCEATLEEVGQAGGQRILQEVSTCRSGSMFWSYDPALMALTWTEMQGFLPVGTGVAHRVTTESLFDGMWRGVMNQPGGPVTSWDTVLQLAGGDGQSWYPTLGCDGILTAIATDGRTLTVHEDVNDPGCADVDIDLTWNPLTDTVDYTVPQFGVYGTAARQLPLQPIAGTWVGQIVEPTVAYDTTLVINPDGAIGSVVGTSSYTLGCSGNLLRVGESGLRWDLLEDITAGGGCADNVSVSLTWDPFTDTVYYTAQPPFYGILATGTLHR